MSVLAVNIGSAATRLRVLGEADELLAGEDLPAGAGLDQALGRLPRPDAVGHRIARGPAGRHEPAAVTPQLLAELRELQARVPGRDAPVLDAIDEVAAALPGVPAIACFDTAFHAQLPDAASTYALPRAWRERWPIGRSGSHGLSHSYAARRAEELAGRGGSLRVVSCHLGAVSSLAAVCGGRCVDTTVGFSPLDGLVMATRSGSVDPGLVLWLAARGVDVEHGLEHESGLLGLAGTSDMRDVLARAGDGESGAVLARDVHDHRLRAGIAAMAAALDGVDVLVFTGGVGEHAPAVRAAAVNGLGFLGLQLDPARNDSAEGDADIGGSSRARVLVVEAREDLEIARGVRAALA